MTNSPEKRIEQAQKNLLRSLTKQQNLSPLFSVKMLIQQTLKFLLIKRRNAHKFKKDEALNKSSMPKLQEAQVHKEKKKKVSK